MDKKDFSPILKDGFREIKLWELDKYFLEPFGENEHRKYLIDRLQEYLREFGLLGIEAEVWIDGSFTTLKPEPADIDVAFLLDHKAVDSLFIVPKKANIFRKLFDRDHVLARYGCDVYMVDKDNEDEKNQWIKTFGTDYNNINSKGIFKIMLKP